MLVSSIYMENFLTLFTKNRPAKLKSFSKLSDCAKIENCGNLKYFSKLKKLASAIFFLIFCVFFSFSQNNQNLNFSSEKHIFDQAGLLSNSEIIDAENMLLETCQNGFYIGFVTTNNTQGFSSEEFADNFYDNYIYKDFFDGVICLIDMQNRNIHISTSGKMIDYLTNARIESVLDEIFPHVANANYFSACKAFNNSIIKFYNLGIPKNQYRSERTNLTEKDFSYTPIKALIALLAGLIMATIFCCSVKSSYSFKKKTYRYPLNSLANIKFTLNQDNFMGEHTVTHIIASEQNLNNNGNCSTVHHSSSGNTHGGGGRSF